MARLGENGMGGQRLMTVLRVLYKTLLQKLRIGPLWVDDDLLA